MKLERMFKKAVAIVTILAMMIPLVSSVVYATSIETKKGTQLKLGISVLHPSKDSKGNKFGYKIGRRVTYRTYVNNNGSADYSNYIFCLDYNGKFPKEDGTKNETYTSQGEFKVGNSSINDEEKTKKIAYLMKNANLYGEFEDKVAEVFADKIESEQDLIPPTTAEKIASLITDDDLFFALQVVIWEITNNLDSTQAITYTIDEKVYNGAGTYPQKDELIKIAEVYYRRLANKYNSGVTATNPTIKDTNKTTVEEGDYFYVGPFHIKSGTNNDFTVKFTDQDGKTLSGYSLVDAQNSQGKKVTNIKRNLDKDLYVKIPTSTTTTKIRMLLDVKGKPENELTLWTSQVSGAQPLLIVRPHSEDVHEETEAPIVRVEKIYDLALRKYITKVNDTEITTRIPEITYNKTLSRIEYKHKKDPVLVKAGDKVVYTITVYNEGEQKGKATVVRDYLPRGLTAVPVSESTINQKYGWVISQDGKYATSAYTAGYELDPFDLANMKVSSVSLQIECKVDADFKDGILTNLAEIMEDNVDDIDSTPGSIKIENINLETYKGKDNKDDLTDSNYFYKGQEDDDDFEKLKVEPEVEKIEMDLALRKYIATINGENKNRQPVVDDSELEAETSTTAKYIHSKTPITVSTGDIVIYTIKVYNEGKIDGYVDEITDYIPEGLGFLVNHQINYDNAWKIDTSSGAPKTVKLGTIKNATNNISSSDFIDENEVANEDVIVGKAIVRTDKYKYTPGGNTNIIPAYDPSKDEPSSVTVQVACVVVAEKLDAKILKNIAAVTGETDKDGNKVTDDSNIKDRDSEPKEIDVDKYPDNTNIQDDDDYEDLTLVSKDYDLALKKFITKIEGKEVSPSREPKVDVTPLTQDGKDAIYELPKNVLKVSYGDHVIYTIRIFNEGETDGIAKEVVDSLPEGLEFVEDSTINKQYGWEKFERESEKGWTSGIKTTYLADKAPIPAFDKENKKLSYVDLQVELKVVSKKSQVIKNIAEITDDDGDDRDSTPDNKIESEDDEDYDNVIPGRYDLALKKFISKVEGKEVSPSREPKVDVDPLVEGKTDAKYTLSKDAVKVKYGDKIVYVIRIYNEGESNAIAKEVIDNLPDGLEFVEDSEINKKYGWEKFERQSEKGWTSGVRTTYLADKDPIPAFDKENKKLSYVDLEIEFKVVTKTASIVKNIAEITDDDGDDDDSTPDNKDENEDDEDYENVIPVVFDLALQKFITAVNEKEVKDRVPTVIINDKKEISYTHPTTPVEVANENVVTYTIRVYNEGNLPGYASVIKDDIPKGLVFLPDNKTNKDYMWKMYRNIKEDEKLDGLKVVTLNGTKYIEVTDVKDAEFIATDYHSKEYADSRKEGPIKAYDQEKGVSDTNPDYRDVKVAFKVNQNAITAEDRIIINTAEITDDQDEDGKPIEDVDSEPNNDKDGEDDIDTEKVTVKYFDLSLLKYVSQVQITENGKTKKTNTGYDGTENPEPIVKVELNRNKLKTTKVTFVFSIKITNEGEIEGYAKEITDYIPKGLEFHEADNKEYRWKSKGNGVVTTDYLKDTLLKPGESAVVKIALRWKKSTNNLGLKTNIAEISEDYNEYNTPDIDSTPNNKKDGEDDQDDASVILSIQTGGSPLYVILTISVLTILSCGIFAIKKYVLI